MIGAWVAAWGVTGLTIFVLAVVTGYADRVLHVDDPVWFGILTVFATLIIPVVWPYFLYLFVVEARDDRR